MIETPTPPSAGSGPSAAQTSEPEPRRSPLAVAVAIGLACQVLVVLWVVYSEVPAKVFISSWSICMPGILLLSLGLLASRRAGSRWRRYLGQRPMLLAYTMVSVSAVLVGYGHIQLMFPVLGSLVWRAESMRWQPLLERVPPWLVPRDRELIQGLFTGESAVPWAAWLLPLSCWFLFMMALYASMLFLAALLSRQWIHGERLTFPMSQLPLEMTSPRSQIFRNRLFWIGFVVPAVLESLIALNTYFPAIPAIEMKHKDMQSAWFPERPFNVLRPFYFGFTPFIIGFAFLAPLDVSFSFWFFSLLSKAERVYGVTMGWDAPSAGPASNRFPYAEEQSFGAFMAFALVALGRSWPGIRAAWSRRGKASEEARGMTLAVLGFAASTATAIGFLWLSGMEWHVGAALVLLILLIAITLSRIRAEAGPAWAFGPPRDVSSALVLAYGSRNLSEGTLTALGAFRWFSRDPRFLPMAFHLEALKIADAIGVRKRVFIPCLLLATAVGVLLGFAAVLHLSYDLGWGSGKVYAGPANAGAGIWNQSLSWSLNPLGSDSLGLPWMVGGGLFTLALIALRTRLVWWPFHPIGYVVAETGAGTSFWFHYLVAWLCKFAVLRYGGHRLYVQAIPLCIGVILGDLLTQTAWSLAAVVLNVPVYQFIS
jgi:hypothetical protein